MTENETYVIVEDVKGYCRCGCCYDLRFSVYRTLCPRLRHKRLVLRHRLVATTVRPRKQKIKIDRHEYLELQIFLSLNMKIYEYVCATYINFNNRVILSIDINIRDGSVLS